MQPAARVKRYGILAPILAVTAMIAWLAFAQFGTSGGTSDGKVIRVVSASYGQSCGAAPGNVTAALEVACGGRSRCSYIVDVNRLNDPAPGCEKSFAVEYACGSSPLPFKVELPPGAGLKEEVVLMCPDDAGLRIHSASYGVNCGAAAGNATSDLRQSCSGNASCEYVVDVNRLGDPAPGCGKEYEVQYSCPGDREYRRASIPGEAGLGKRLALACRTGE